MDKLEALGQVCRLVQDQQLCQLWVSQLTPM